MPLSGSFRSSSFYGLDTGIETCEIARTSRMVSEYTGIAVPPNKAVVGANAFAHEAGIHQDGVLKNRLTYEMLTYEIMTASSVGWEGTSLVLGKHSGRHALRVRLAALGYELAEEELSRVFARFKDLGDDKKVFEAGDLEALICATAPHQGRA